MRNKSKIASITNILGNLFLFIIKIVIGMIFSSMALISDAINSLSDMISSLIIHYSITIASKKPDKNHPFGHSRSEPIAALISGLIMWILAYQIIETGIGKIINKETINYSPLLIYVLIATIIIKFFMYMYSKHIFKMENSPAIEAASKDHINDIMISSIAILGITINEFADIYWFDTFAGFLIALWIIKTGYEILKTNIDYLMGRKPKDELVRKIKKEALQVKGVKGLNDVLAQHLGSLVQIEIHIEVDKKISLEKAHRISKRVKKRLEERKDINNAFVHIDPV